MRRFKDLGRERVWLEETVVEWSDVVASGELAMCGTLHAIMGEKHSELAAKGAAPAAPVYKARVVFGGHAIKTTTREAPEALFQEVSGPPLTS